MHTMGQGQSRWGIRIKRAVRCNWRAYAALRGVAAIRELECSRSNALRRVGHNMCNYMFVLFINACICVYIHHLQETIDPLECGCLTATPASRSPPAPDLTLLPPPSLAISASWSSADLYTQTRSVFGCITVLYSTDLQVPSDCPLATDSSNTYLLLLQLPSDAQHHGHINR